MARTANAVCERGTETKKPEVLLQQYRAFSLLSNSFEDQADPPAGGEV